MELDPANRFRRCFGNTARWLFTDSCQILLFLFRFFLRTHARALLTVCLAFSFDSDRQLIQIFSLSRWQHAKIGRQDSIEKRIAEAVNLADVSFRLCSVFDFVRTLFRGYRSIRVRTAPGLETARFSGWKPKPDVDTCLRLGFSFFGLGREGKKFEQTQQQNR